jgi:hypothetical protein
VRFPIDGKEGNSMKWTTCRLRGGAWPLWPGLVIFLFGTELAQANFIFIGYNGVTPYPGDETTVFFPPSPVVLDRIRPDAPRLGSGETIVDSLGQIRTIYITAPPLNDLGQRFSVGPYEVDAQLDDTAHFVGRGNVTIKFETVGFGVLPQTDFINDPEYDIVVTVLQLPDGAHGAKAQFANMPLPGFSVPIANVPFFIDLVVEDTISVSGTLDVPFNFVLQATGVNGASLNVFDTAQLSFVLPPGASVSTDGGFFQSGPVAPEPSSLLLLATGIAGLLGYGWRQRKQGARDHASIKEFA